MHSALYATVGYFALLLTVRVLSRRPGAQMTLFEFVIVFLMGGIIILCVVGNDHSETNSICAVLTVALLHRFISGLKDRFPKLQRLIDGTSLLLLKDGEWQTRTMGRTRIQDTDVMAAARTKGLRSLDEIKYAVLERNGAISVIEKDQ